MRANAWIVAATLAVLGSCTCKNTIQSQQGALAIDDGTTDVTGKADAFADTCPNGQTTKSLSIVNTSLTDVEVSAVSVTSGAFSAQPPTLPFTVPAGGTVALPVTFAPTTTGPAVGTLTVTSDAQNSPITVSLNGTGTSGGPSPSYSATCGYLGPDGGPVTQQFPCSTLLWQAAIGSTVDDTLQISDEGCPALVIESAVISIEGVEDGGVSPFTLPSLPTLPATISPGTPLTLTIAYTPTVAGTFDLATLTLTTNDPDAGLGGSETPGVFVYNLEGTGQAPLVQITPAQEDFGAVPQGVMVSQLFTVQNNGSLPVTLQAPTLANGAPYSIAGAWTDGQTLSAVGGSSSSIQCSVDFTSPGNGLFQDRLTVDYSSSEGSGSVSASLIAHSSGELCPSPNPLQMPATGFCGTITAPLVLGNCGNADLHVSAVAFADGGDPDDTFSVTLPTGTTLPVDIIADAGITVTVTYVDNGHLTDPVGTLVVVSDDPFAPDGGTPISVVAQVSAVPPPGDSPAQAPDSGVGLGVTTEFVASGSDAPLYSFTWSVVPSGCGGSTLVSDGGVAWVTPTSTAKCNICLQAYEQPVDGGFNCGFDSGVPGHCTPFNP
jgi:hypothetical protein